MTAMTQIVLAAALVLSIIIPFGYYLLGEKSRGRYKTAIGCKCILLLWHHADRSSCYVCRQCIRTGSYRF